MSVAVASLVAGFYGKIPSRGDFVRGGLPRGFVEPWDAWLQEMLAGSREILGARWLPAWMEAPIWRFALPARHCGAEAVLGVWMPSIDAAGRHFPLTLARLGGGAADAEAWLDFAEAAGLAALEQDLAPDHLLGRLAGYPVPDDAGPGQGPATGAVWWTDGSPFVPPTRLVRGAMPDATTFAAMLHAVPDGAGRDQPDSPPEAGGAGP